MFLENGQVVGMAFSGFAGTADNIGYVIPCCVISVSVSVRLFVCVFHVGDAHLIWSLQNFIRDFRKNGAFSGIAELGFSYQVQL